MDTSKDYYETVMRDYKTYGHGRSLEQFCRDEAVDYKWIGKAKALYGEEPKGKSVKTKTKTRDKSADMIQLHFDPGPAEIPAEEPDTTPGAQPTLRTQKTEAPAWMVESLTVRTPAGHGIEIRTSNPSAVAELLSKLTA